MSNEMNTGAMPSVSKNLNVGAENKKAYAVDGPNLMVQGESRTRNDRMDLEGGAGPNMKPSNRDTYQ